MQNLFNLRYELRYSYISSMHFRILWSSQEKLSVILPRVHEFITLYLIFALIYISHFLWWLQSNISFIKPFKPYKTPIYWLQKNWYITRFVPVPLFVLWWKPYIMCSKSLRYTEYMHYSDICLIITFQYFFY